jgi:hypothetical protein
MITPIRALFLRRLRSTDPSKCWLWPDSQLNGTGYGQLTIMRNGHRVRFLAHRLSYRIFIGEIPVGNQVMHSCDCKRCVNPRHLSVGTQLENESGKVARGRSNRGEDRWCATLTNRQAQHLLDRYRSGISIPELAKEFGTSYGVAYSIAKRKRWKYLS